LLNVLKKNRVFNVFCIFEGFYFNGLLKQKLYVVYDRTVKLQSICFFGGSVQRWCRTWSKLFKPESSSDSNEYL